MDPSPTARPATRYDVEERRRQLLILGTDLFSHRSYDSISIDDIATAANVSKGLLYHYFPTKRDFYIAAVDYAARELRQLIEPDPTLPEIEKLRFSLNAYFNYVETRAAGYVTLVRGGIGSDPEVRRIVDSVRDDVVGLSVRALGVKGKPTPLLNYALRGWLALLEQTSLDWLDGREVEWEKLLNLLELTLVSTIAATAQLDEHAGIDLSVLDDIYAPLLRTVEK